MKKNILITILILIIAFLMIFIVLDKRIVYYKDSETVAENGGTGDAVAAESDSYKDDEVVNANNADYIITIDPGHQSKGDSSQEPVAPGAATSKAKVSSGTRGVSTGIPEYKVNLQVSLKLRDELEDRGYTVIMTREIDDVNISNSERAEIANNADSDVFVRIHCNGSENSGISGALTMCQTKSNPYCGDLYAESRMLSECILEKLCLETNAKSIGVSETDTMSGINWSRVPVTIVEMGFMTNYEEDKLLCDDEYQNKLAIGIANGIEDYFANCDK